MTEFTSPTYVLDLRDSSHRATLASVTPGAEVAVLVRPEDDEVVQPTRAKGTLSSDGELFEVFVSTGSGEQRHSWNYDALKDAIRAYSKSHRG